MRIFCPWRMYLAYISVLFPVGFTSSFLPFRCSCSSLCMSEKASIEWITSFSSFLSSLKTGSFCFDIKFSNVLQVFWFLCHITHSLHHRNMKQFLESDHSDLKHKLFVGTSQWFRLDRFLFQSQKLTSHSGSMSWCGFEWFPFVLAQISNLNRFVHHYFIIILNMGKWSNSKIIWLEKNSF